MITTNSIEFKQKLDIMKRTKYIFILPFFLAVTILYAQPFSTGGIQCTSHGKPDCEQHVSPCSLNTLQLTAITYPANWLPNTSFTIQIKDVVADTLLLATVNGLALTSFCIPEDQCLELTVLNAQGLPQLPPGAYTLLVNGDTIANAADPGLAEVYNLGSCCSVALAITPTIQQIGCHGDENGAIVLSVNGGVGPYQTNWSNGTANTDALHNLEAGIYSATVTDALGCATVVGPNNVVEPSLLEATVSSQLPSTSGLSDGTASVSPMGGSPSYTYSWSTGSTTSTAINLGNGTYTVVITDQNGCSIERTIDLMPLTVSLKVYLEGNMDTTLVMQDRLRQLSLIPLAQPYAVAPFNYMGTETTMSTVLAQPGNTAVIDWVLVQLRSSISNVIATKAALLLRNGKVVAEDGVSPLLFDGYGPGDYYVAIYHRNHMAIMTKELVLPVSGALVYDFTIEDSYKTVGFGQNAIGSSVWAMIAGDGDQASNPQANDINASDRILWQTFNGTFNQYHETDYNLDGDVNGMDKINWSLNNGFFNNVPR